MTTTPAARAWVAPDPRQLPDWRARMVEYTESHDAMSYLAAAMNAGQATILPVFDAGTARGLSPGSLAAPLLAGLEARRLRQASLYYATEDMTALAVAAGTTAPIEPVRTARMPAPSGLMLFAAPIGGYDVHLPDMLGERGGYTGVPDLTVTIPIVAVSWSNWSPRDVTITGGPAPSWYYQTPPSGDLVALPRELDGIWLTFYSPPGGPWAALPPSTVVAHLPGDGTAVTAHRLMTDPPGTPLTWDNEMVLRPGATFAPEPVPDTSQQWAQVLYTAWQLIGQSGGSNPLAEVEQVPRDRAGRKRDERAGLPADGVRIVHVHSAHRPPKAAADQDAAASTGRRAPSWSCRWPVRPYRRNTCLNPRGHETGACEHEDRIVPAHIKGPADKPLRIAETVNLWDSQPGAEDAAAATAGHGREEQQDHGVD